MPSALASSEMNAHTGKREKTPRWRRLGAILALATVALASCSTIEEIGSTTPEGLAHTVGPTQTLRPVPTMSEQDTATFGGPASEATAIPSSPEVVTTLPTAEAAKTLDLPQDILDSLDRYKSYIDPASVRTIPIASGSTEVSFKPADLGDIGDLASKVALRVFTSESPNDSFTTDVGPELANGLATDVVLTVPVPPIAELNQPVPNPNSAFLFSDVVYERYGCGDMVGVVVKSTEAYVFLAYIPREATQVS